ncbi:MAG: hypothetical protein IH784_05745 [Bacteroidetes bacterium]|nr:hypothetical protein [Bacteroidota bacterium]
MKTSKIFWGTLFIVLGLLVLLNNFSSINVHWGDLWQFWPILLVLIGISMLVKNKFGKSALAGAAAILLALILFTSVKLTTDFIKGDFELVFNGDEDYNFVTTEYRESFDTTIAKAKLFLDAGLGSFNIGDTTSELIFVKTEGIEKHYKLTKQVHDNVSKLKLKMKKTIFHLGKNKFKNRVEISLNEKPTWDINIDGGASAINLDLTKFKIENVYVGMGAASLDVKLGTLSDKTRLNIEAGASNIDILVPKDVGCQVKTDDVLSSKNIYGFIKIKSGLYRTAEFDEASKKIFIEIDCGVSSINVRRYEE